ncbi:MAG: DUF559 domain-containing protein [Clostridia bacterium]|nr:DUF559 domain-containing protein [Clostridia bacterium]
MKNERSDILKPISQTLRKNMTREEKHLWYDFLKKLPFNVKRQMMIGDYIVDFYIASAKIVIEIDGRQHSMPENKESDLERDKKLFDKGIRVLRYSNKSVNYNFNAVCSDIMKNLGITAADLIK